MTQTVRAAIIGLGWWGRVLVESVPAGGGIRFTHAVTLDAAAAADFASRHHLILGDDYEAVLADWSVDAVVLATPHSVHVEQIFAAARAGKAVFSEKPLALRLTDAQRAVDACRAAGVVLEIGTDKRFLPGVRALQRLTDGGTLGRVLHVEAHYGNDNSLTARGGAWRDSPSETPGGGMTGPGLHALDGLVGLAGPIVRVDARLHRHQHPTRPVDAVTALLEFASGATGVLGCVRYLSSSGSTCSAPPDGRRSTASRH